MIYLTRLDLDSTYAADVLPPLMILGFGMGSIMPASMQTATLGVDRAVRRRRLGDGQHEPAGRRLDRHGAAEHARRDRGDRLRRVAPAADARAMAAEAAVHSYATAYWWGAGFFAFGAVLAALLFRRRSQGLSLSHTPAPAASVGTEPISVH